MTKSMPQPSAATDHGARADDYTAGSEALSRASEAGLTVLDRDLRYLRVNERLATMNGVPLEARIGRTVRDVTPLVGETVARPGVVARWVEDAFSIKRRNGSLWAAGCRK